MLTKQASSPTYEQRPWLQRRQELGGTHPYESGASQDPVRGHICFDRTRKGFALCQQTPHHNAKLLVKSTVK